MVIVFRYATENDGHWVVRENPVAVLDLLEEIKKALGVSEEEVKMSGENIGHVISKKIEELNTEGTTSGLFHKAFYTKFVVCSL